MKATGVVRRIDELGRIVIPKEIRKNFRIKDGENVEIFIDDEENIILKKHSTLNNISIIADIITESLAQCIDKTVIITDMNNIISTFGSLKNNFSNKECSNEYINLIETRSKIIDYKKSNIKITNEIVSCSHIIYPLILRGDLIGSIGIISDTTIDHTDINLIEFATKILLKYVEE
jgi:AbrB family transcriptional regulator (stage V sporulation protein T)